MNKNHDALIIYDFISPNLILLSCCLIYFIIQCFPNYITPMPGASQTKSAADCSQLYLIPKKMFPAIKCSCVF